MTLDPPTYLASIQSNIRQRPIPWDGAVRAGTLTEEQYAKIRAVDKAKKPEQRKEIVSGDIDGYRVLFVGDEGKTSVLETSGKHANVIQYILVLLGDLLEGKSFPLRLCDTSGSWKWCCNIVHLYSDFRHNQFAHANMTSSPSCSISSQGPFQDKGAFPTFFASTQLD